MSRTVLDDQPPTSQGDPSSAHQVETAWRPPTASCQMPVYVIVILAGLLNGCSVNRPQDTIVYQRDRDPSWMFYSYETLDASDTMPNPDNFTWTETIAIKRGFPGGHVRTGSTTD